MLKIGPIELIELISQTEANRDINALANYACGDLDYDSANDVAKKHDYKLKSRIDAKLPRKGTLVHYKNVPCGTHSFFLETTSDKTQITCSRCTRMVLSGKIRRTKTT